MTRFEGKLLIRLIRFLFDKRDFISRIIIKPMQSRIGGHSNWNLDFEIEYIDSYNDYDDYRLDQKQFSGQDGFSAQNKYEYYRLIGYIYHAAILTVGISKKFFVYDNYDKLVDLNIIDYTKKSCLIYHIKDNQHLIDNYYDVPYDEINIVEELKKVKLDQQRYEDAYFRLQEIYHNNFKKAHNRVLAGRLVNQTKLTMREINQNPDIIEAYKEIEKIDRYIKSG